MKREKKDNFKEIYNQDGTVNRIKITSNIFENNNDKSINKKMKEYLRKHIGEVYTIIESGQKIYLRRDLPYEYGYSIYSRNLKRSEKIA